MIFKIVNWINDTKNPAYDSGMYPMKLFDLVVDDRLVQFSLYECELEKNIKIKYR